MSTAQARSPHVERLTWDEIQVRYPDEFLGLAEVERVQPGDQIVSARVVCHDRGVRALLSATVEPYELLVYPLSGRADPRRRRLILDDDLRDAIHRRR